MKIGFIGIGKLGLCLAGLFSKSGHRLLVYDKKIKNTDQLNQSMQTGEPGIEKLIQKSNSLQIESTIAGVINNTSITFVCINTPSLASGKYDTSGLFDICRQIKASDTTNKILVVVCTTNPGDCEKMQSILNENSIDVVYTPEFIAQGSIINDLRAPDLAIYGGKKQSINKVHKLYKKTYKLFHRPTCINMSLTAAEITKISINAFLTTKITFANLIGKIVYKSGLITEIHNVLHAIGSDSRVGKKFLKFGFGFGGPCLPRDNIALSKYSQEINANYNLGEVVDNINNSHENFILEMLIEQNKDSLPFYFDTLFYKKSARFDTPSQKKNICEKLLQQGYKIHVGELTLDQELNKQIKLGIPTEKYFHVRI